MKSPPRHGARGLPAAGALAGHVAQLVQRSLGQVLQASAAAEGAPAPLRQPAAARAEGLHLLAAAHPGGPAARRDALTLYSRCLQHYRQQVQPRLCPGQAQDDLGAAAAFFVLANLAVLEGRAPLDAALPAVERQMRRLLGGTAPEGHGIEPGTGDVTGHAAAAAAAAMRADRQRSFEQLAALGVLVNESRLAAATQGEAAQAHLRQAAQAYLQDLLGLPPAQLSVSAAGLAWQATAH